MSLLALTLLGGCMHTTPAPEDPKAGWPSWRLVMSRADTPAIIAHRGASAQAPENTLAAYRRAVELGAQAVETDLHLSADGRVVMIHDPTVERTTDGEGVVAEMTWEQLRALDAGAWFGPQFAGERLPELDELLAMPPDELVLCLEIKEGEGIEPLIRDRVVAAGAERRVVFFSFEAELLGRMKALMPEAPALFLVRPRPGEDGPGSLPLEAVEVARGLGADLVGVSYKRLSAEFVDAVHGADLPLFAYTVNDPSVLPALEQAGVVGIITDAPDALATALGRALP